MIPALFTGSRVYGKPKKSSDLDLVLLVSDEEFDLLVKVASRITGYSEFGSPQYDVGDGRSGSFRFGPLNVIAMTSEVAFACFEKSTKELSEKAPVDREEACEHMKANRQKFGLDYTSRDQEKYFEKTDRERKKSKTFKLRGENEDDDIPF